MRVMKDLNIAPENTMAIGDGENDIEMLQAVGTSVAMGNAVQKLKDVASQVVGSNDEDGVAQAIEMFVTGKIEGKKPTEAKAVAKAIQSEKADSKDTKSEAKTDTKETEEKSE